MYIGRFPRSGKGGAARKEGKLISAHMSYNYICLLPTVFDLCELMITLYLSPRRCGFGKGRSTLQAIEKVTREIYDSRRPKLF